MKFVDDDDDDDDDDDVELLSGTDGDEMRKKSVSKSK